jgi:hypothetical protein
VYDVVATVMNATSVSDLGVATTLLLNKADFESAGIATSASTGSVVSPTLTFVKAKPIVSYVSSQA